MDLIKINTESITLDQFLKWAGVVSTGGEGKKLITSGQVKLNGEVETRRGKKLYRDDVINIGDLVLKVE